MSYINEAINVMLVLIPLGASARVAYCIICIINDPDDEKMYRKRIKNIIWFTIIAECALSIISLIKAYL